MNEQFSKPWFRASLRYGGCSVIEGFFFPIVNLPSSRRGDCQRCDQHEIAPEKVPFSIVFVANIEAIWSAFHQPYGISKIPSGCHPDSYLAETAAMPEPDEKKAFAARLKQALRRSSKKIGTASELATQFNLRHPAESITPQAAQKWLAGTARPTIDKIRTLAEWLDVSEQWLRYGVTDMKRSRPVKNARISEQTIHPTSDELELIRRIRRLSAYRRQLVEGVVEQFALDGEIWKE